MPAKDRPACKRCTTLPLRHAHRHNPKHALARYGLVCSVRAWLGTKQKTNSNRTTRHWPRQVRASAAQI
eukprot:5283042-Amphidinium_carterae.1